MTSSPTISSQVEYQSHSEPNCILKLDVKVSHDLSIKTHQEAIKEVNKAKPLPGFRKGKAPDALVVKNFPQEIDHVWREKLAQMATHECLKTAPKPLTRETRVRYEVTHPSLVEPSTLTLRYEVEPKIPELDFSDFKMTQIEKPAVNDEKILETIRQTQYFFASWEAVTDRAVAMNDCVILNVDVLEEDQAKPLFQGTRFEVNNKHMAQWMLDAVIGMKVGENKQTLSVADEDASKEEKTLFQPKNVRLTLVDIQTASLPELNDEFAKKVGAASLDEFRGRIAEILSKQSAAHVLEKEREAITQFLLDKYPFDLPHSQVEREVRFRLKQLFDDPHFGPYWESLNDQERKNSVDALMVQSQKAIRMFYLSRKVMQDKNLTITPEEMKKPPIEPLEVLINPILNPAQQGVDMNHAESYSKLILEKAQDALLADARNLS